MKPGGKKRLQYAICVSGAAGGYTVKKSSEDAEALGVAIAKAGHILTTGATVGLPFYAARGAKSAGGTSIGFSPASSLREHVRKYRLPYHYFDFINYTGMNYVGRDLYLVQSSDAVITIGGRLGSLHEFTSALEAGIPTAVLIGSGGASDIIPSLMNSLQPEWNRRVVYDDDPVRLVKAIVKLLDEEYADIRKEIESRSVDWFLENPKPAQAG